MEQNRQYRKIYIEESDELLQEMNKALLTLEKDSQDSNALNAIFRAAHTLKSMSASMGYLPISDLAHKMEDLLDRLRKREIDVSDNTVDVLFKSFDLLERMVRLVAEDKKRECDISPTIAALDKIIGDTVIRPIKEDKVSKDLSLNVFIKKALVRTKKEGYKAFHIKVKLEKACVLKSVRVFMVFRNLHSIGEVIKSIPDSQAIEEERFDQTFGCVFVTKEGEGNIKKRVLEVLEIKEVKIKEIQIDSSWEKEIPLDDIQDIKEEQTNTSGHMRKIQSVRIDVSRLNKLMNLVEELAVGKLRLFEVASRFPDPELKNILEQFNRLTDDLQTEVMQARLVPVAHIFDRFPRLVRDLAKKQQKQIRFEVIGGNIELDRTILDEIGDPLIHILRNAIDHGIESLSERRKNGKPEEGSIVLSARREKSHVFIDVSDDGQGMDVKEIRDAAIRKKIITKEEAESMRDEEIFLLAAHPGFTTNKEVTEISGRGVGLDVARDKAIDLGGGLLIKSDIGKGTRVSMRLPVTTAVIQALLVLIRDKVFAIPISSIVEIIVVDKASIKKVKRQETILHRDKVIPIARPKRVLKTLKDRDDTQDNISDKQSIVIVEYNAKQFGIVVDRLVSQQDIVIKQLTKELKGIRGFSGATILGDGSVALVMDVATLI